MMIHPKKDENEKKRKVREQENKFSLRFIRRRERRGKKGKQVKLMMLMTRRRFIPIGDCFGFEILLKLICPSPRNSQAKARTSEHFTNESPPPPSIRAQIKIN